eukprot:s204_g24.t1
MPPFQDEPEDACQLHVKKRRRVSGQERSGASLFGEEPEETLPQRPSSSSRGSRPCLFGEEPEEAFGRGGQNSSSTGSREPSVHVQELDRQDPHSSSDEEGESRPAALNIGWSALNMFSKAKFMNKVSTVGEPPRKKRPYNNANRAQRASETKKNPCRSYKTTALDPSRFIRRGRSSGQEDTDFDLDSDCDVEELKDFLDTPKSAMWDVIQTGEKKVTKFLDPGTVADLYQHYVATRQLFGASAVSQLVTLRH